MFVLHFLQHSRLQLFISMVSTEGFHSCANKKKNLKEDLSFRPFHSMCLSLFPLLRDWSCWSFVTFLLSLILSFRSVTQIWLHVGWCVCMHVCAQAVCRTWGGYLEQWSDPVCTTVRDAALWWWPRANALQEDLWWHLLHPTVLEPFSYQPS